MHHFVGASCNGREGNPYGGEVRYDPVGPLLVCSCTEISKMQYQGMVQQGGQSGQA